MFFKAFTAIEGSPLRKLLTFTVEYQASQVLANCDPVFLQRAVEEEILPESLFEEIVFFGAVPRQKQDEVKQYFQDHAPSLYDTARQLLSELGNEKLRDDIQRPVISEDEVQALQKMGETE